MWTLKITLGIKNTLELVRFVSPPSTRVTPITKISPYNNRRMHRIDALLVGAFDDTFDRKDNFFFFFLRNN